MKGIYISNSFRRIYQVRLFLNQRQKMKYMKTTSCKLYSENSLKSYDNKMGYLSKMILDLTFINGSWLVVDILRYKESCNVQTLHVLSLKTEKEVNAKITYI